MQKKIGFLMIIFMIFFTGCALFGPNITTELKKAHINFEDKQSILSLEKNPNLFWLWVQWDPIKYLMTKEEKKLAKKMLEIAEKNKGEFVNIEDAVAIEAFVEWFWQRRDDNQYDDVNEFKENFYNRVIEAQTRFGREEDAERKRRCAYGNGWETDMGMIYILLGEPFDRARHSVDSLLMFFGNYSQSSFLPQEIEIWYYDFSDFDIDEYNGFLFQDGVAWILFEKSSFGLWRFGQETFDLFYNYENYYNPLSGASQTYSYYISEVYEFIEAVAESYVYDSDLKFEDMFIEWVPVKK